MDCKIPTPENIRLIFRDTYLLYTKFKDVQTKQDFQSLLDESHDLEKKYPFEVARKMIIDVVDVISLQWKGRNEI